MAHRVAAGALADLDDAWYSLAKKSGVAAADQWIDAITEKFLLLGQHRFLGSARKEDFGKGWRSFEVGEYAIVYIVEDRDLLVLRVMHRQRDLEPLLAEAPPKKA
jgi:plasmid stabilization system protein ParE